MAGTKTLVLGIGNLLLCDEGVGVHVVHAMMDEEHPEGTVILDIGTAILDALPEIEQADRIIVIDAVKADGPPGSVYRMPLDAFAASPILPSMHGFDLPRVFSLARRTDCPEVVVIGVEPARIGWSLELSVEVARALPFVVSLVRREIERPRRVQGEGSCLETPHIPVMSEAGSLLLH